MHRRKLIVLGGQKRHTFYNFMEALSDCDFLSEFGHKMNEKRVDFAAVYLNGQIYAIGGKSHESEWLSSVESFDDDSWKFVSQFSKIRSQSICTWKQNL